MKKLLIFIMILFISINCSAIYTPWYCGSCIEQNKTTGDYYLKIGYDFPPAWPWANYSIIPVNFPTVQIFEAYLLPTGACPSNLGQNNGVGGYHYFNLSQYPNVLNDILNPVGNTGPYLSFFTDLGYSNSTFSPQNYLTYDKFEAIQFCENPLACAGDFSYSISTSGNSTINPLIVFDDILLPNVTSSFISTLNCNYSNFISPYGFISVVCNGKGKPPYACGIPIFVIEDTWDFGDGSISTFSSLINPSSYDIPNNSQNPFIHCYDINNFTGMVCHRKTIARYCVDFDNNMNKCYHDKELVYDCTSCINLCLPEEITIHNGDLFKSNREIKSSSQTNLVITPNPVNNQLSIDLISTIINSNLFIKIIDIEGKIVLENKVVATIGNNNFKLNVASLKSGIYIVSIIGKELNHTSKIEVKH